jgi:hypothetical protein
MTNNRLSGVLTGLAVIAMAIVSTAPGWAQMPADVAAQLSQNVNQDVIVIMKSQHAAAFKGSSADLQRANAIADEQAPLMDELRQVQAVNIKNYRLVNALAARVSKGEVDRLKANPAVASVIPDFMIRGPQRSRTKAATQGTVRANISTTLTPNVIPGACSDTAQLVPEGLALTNTDSDVVGAPTAHSLGITGAGVKVAWIADGVDPNNVNLVRKNHTSVFIDLQDFTGTGLGQPTGGDEAFLDSNTIAGQGTFVYNVQNFSAQSDPTPCRIRIEGVAPGASLVALEAFTEFGGLTSAILQAIDYAVETDHVDVINESFGSNHFPDVTALDVQKQFDEAAVAAGVVVSVSSGDGGSTNTIGSPASDPLLIGAGASTQFQAYAQLNYAAARYFATTGWLSNNISPFSSSGFTETGGTISLVAPGDLSFASCDASYEFSECINYTGQPSNVEESGGTSESSPFVAGAAALVIQAYRQTHGGASPTPALVKQILVSTAGDLGAPTTEQGAGLLNTYQAVLMAESISTSDGSPTPVGATLLVSQNQLSAVGAPGTMNHWDVTVTNTGAYTQTVNLSGRTLGPNQNVQTGKVWLIDGTSPQFVNYQGTPNNYRTFTFQVPAGADRLDASIAYPSIPNPSIPNPSTLNPRVRLILIDPQGRFAAHSIPQGIGNFGNVDVVAPVPGKWKGVIFGDVAADYGTNGAVPWQVETQQFIPFATIKPSSLELAPGASQTVTISAQTPSSPGDLAGSILLTPGLGFGGAATIPVTLRSQVQPALGGAFSGVLTGGNGRPPGEGQVEYFQFNVGKGVRNITANLSLSSDARDLVGMFLVGPDGETLGYGQNNLTYPQTLSATAYTLNPVGGLWTLIVSFADNIVGDKISVPFSGNILFNNVSVQASGLPDGPGHHLAAGTPVSYPIQITNNGAAPLYFFIDARLNTTTPLALVSITLATGVPLPLSIYLSPPVWIVPTQTSSISVAQTSSVPAMFDLASYSGDPDVNSSNLGPGPLCSTTASASDTPMGGTVTAGVWTAPPSECGPYAGPAPAGTANLTMTATTKAFDPAVSSPTGDVWLLATNPAAVLNPIGINPGDAGVVFVTITPSGASGTVVSGVLYVNSFNNDIPPDGALGGDELAALPYTYTIK